MPQKRFFIFSLVIMLSVLGIAAGSSHAFTASQGASQAPLMLAQSQSQYSNQQANGRLDRAEGLNNEGLRAYSAGDYKAAIRDYNQALRVDPKDAKIYNNRGVTYAKMGDYGKAIKDYNMAVRLNPEFAEAYHNRAVAHFRVQQYAQSCSDLRRFRDMGGTPSPEFLRDLQSASGQGHC